MKNLEDIAAYRKSIERQWVHIFLARLDGDIEQVRGEILRKDPLPDLEECYALIRREAFVDPFFSRAPPLDRRDSLLFGENFVFGKVRVATYFILF